MENLDKDNQLISLDFSNEYIDPCFLISGFLDPFFKFEFINHSHLSNHVKTKLKDKIISYLKNDIETDTRLLQTTHNSTPTQAPTQSTTETNTQSIRFPPNIVASTLNHLPTTNKQQGNESPSKRRKYFQFSSKAINNAAPNNNTRSPIDILLDEIKLYIVQPYTEEESSEFWNLNQNKFPTLYKMAIKYLSIPATSAPVERLFSYSGYIMRPHRSRLTGENLYQATLIRCNFDIISDYYPSHTNEI